MIDLDELEAYELDPWQDVDLRGVTKLEEMLDEIERRSGIAWSVRSDCIAITSREDASTSLETRFYPARDLLAVGMIQNVRGNPTLTGLAVADIRKKPEKQLGVFRTFELGSAEQSAAANAS